MARLCIARQSFAAHSNGVAEHGSGKTERSFAMARLAQQSEDAGLAEMSAVFSVISAVVENNRPQPNPGILSINQQTERAMARNARHEPQRGAAMTFTKALAIFASILALCSSIRSIRNHEADSFRGGAIVAVIVFSLIIVLSLLSTLAKTL